MSVVIPHLGKLRPNKGFHSTCQDQVLSSS